MKKSKKAAVITGVSCIAVGLIATLASLVWIDFDFTKLNTTTFETTSYEIQENFQNIDIRDFVCNIRLVPAEDGVCRVVCAETDRITNTVEVIEDTLTITRTDRRRWYERIQIWWGNDLSVTVYLPEKTYQSLYLKTVSGHIEVPDTFSFSDVELLSTSGDISFAAGSSKGLLIQSTSGHIRAQNAAGGPVEAVTTSGDIVLSDITADTLHVKTTSGHIRVENITAGSAQAVTTSGDVLLSEATADSVQTKTTSGHTILSDLTVDTLQAKTTSGDIRLSSAIISGHADLQAVSGHIQLKDSDAGSFAIQTVSGDVTGTILSPKNFATAAASGDMQIPSSDTSAGNCSITTTSGHIRIDIPA